jgi:hypothetical protein
VLSNRADLISGGDALVAARLAPGTDAAAVRVTLNGSDITSNFAVRENGQYQGLVTGLVEGENLLRARLPDGSGHEITIKNHPIGGPVFSGEQIQTWLCRTQLQGGTTPALGASVDEKCNAAAPIVELFYRSTGNQWVAYTPTTLPELIQPTTTDEGKTVPFIIQRVTGTANRGIYQIAVLVDPTKPIAPWSTGQPWNLKYVNTFGGACSVNYQQPTVGDVRSVARLGLGFAVGTSSLNTYGNQCSDVISAEALMMTKEIIVERWGPIRYTIGDGGSAGTMQQHMISGAYPRAVERPHDEPAVRRPLVPGRRLVRLPGAVPLFRAGRWRPLRSQPPAGAEVAMRSSTRPPCGSSSMAPTRPIRTPSARRRSASPSPS